MRAAEWIHLVVFGMFIGLSWARQLPATRRVQATGIGAAGLAATLAGAQFGGRIVRDWLPAALVLLVYRQAGTFFTKADPQLEAALEGIDARVLKRPMEWLARHRAGGWIAAYLELAYLLCYPMIPMSLGALYILRLARHADFFWTVVLTSTYLSYGALPFLQTLPPRMLAEVWLAPMRAGRIRRFNLWILRHASIHANTFPSAHVSASTAAALVIAWFAPWPAGAAFLWMAASIAAGTFAGRYHFSSDAVVGSAAAAIVFAASRWLAA